MSKRKHRGLRGINEDSFAQERTQIVENYKSRGRTCPAAKEGLVESAGHHQRVIMVQGGEYAGSRQETRALNLIESFKTDIDKVCGCTARTSRFGRKS
jgi:hypothetical protein